METYILSTEEET